MNEIQTAFADLKDRIYEARLDDLEEEVRQVHLGKHSAIRDRVEEAQELCKERMAMARRRHDFTAQSLMAEYDATREMARQQFSYAAAQLRLTMMTAIECRLQQLAMDHQMIEEATAVSRSYRKSTPQKRHYEDHPMTAATRSMPTTPSKRSRDASSAIMVDPVVHSPQPPPLHHYSTRSRIADVGSA
ncbi:Sds3-like protein [Syncephalis fuscata]|nr:Sds3-like protein [Syncephalis fuscata]